MTVEYDDDLIESAREMRNDPAARKMWRQLIEQHPGLASAVEHPKQKPSAKQGGTSRSLQPGKCWAEADRGRRYRRTGEWSGDPRPYTAGQDSPDENPFRSVFADDGLNVADAQSPREISPLCRWCGRDLGLPRDADGYVEVGFEKPRQYCGERCIRDADNYRDRRRRLRNNPRRAAKVKAVALAALPQRLPTGDVAPWTVPCWAADPWLRLNLSGSVPIGRGQPQAYPDPTGNAVVAGCIPRREGLEALGVPMGKVDPGQRRYYPTVVENGMGYYEKLVLNGVTGITLTRHHHYRKRGVISR